MSMKKNIKISNREVEILNLMSNGYTSKEIGKTLFISSLTVDKHKRNMLHKFRAKNAVEMIAQAFCTGFLSIPHLSDKFEPIFCSSVKSCS